MDYFPFIIIFIIVIAIGYILSRPFTRQVDLQETLKPMDDFQDQYQNLLQEIKTTEQKYAAGALDKETCLAQIDEKKKMAANVLRLIHPPVEDEITLNQDANGLDQINHLTASNSPPRGSLYCPQCGDLVLLSDKFCMYCGHRLQP